MTARMIAADMKRHNGLMTLADLRGYGAKERAPVRTTYRGNEISLKAEGGPTCLTRPIWREY